MMASDTMVPGVFTDLFLLPALLVTLRIGEPMRPRARHVSASAAA